MREPTTHAIDWAEHGGYFTRCGYFTERPELMSDAPTCARCQCWLGHHHWIADPVDNEMCCGVCGGIAQSDGSESDG